MKKNEEYRIGSIATRYATCFFFEAGGVVAVQENKATRIIKTKCEIKGARIEHTNKNA
jgi:uncharacterized protein (UPF0179 family)